MRHTFVRRLAAILIIVCANAASAQTAALRPAAMRSSEPRPAETAQTPQAGVGTAARAIDAADLSAYVDGLIEAGMKHDGIAGVSVAIVDRQGPLLLRGYGIAGQSPSRPVNPERSLFRIASISKTFTYLLGLKLVDSGKLKLDAPVNDYLPAALKLPDDGFKPVLVRHLFTHTAGYEDSAMGHLFTDRGDGVSSVEEYLAKHRPQRVREPGTHAVYSNYSVALLGAIIARIEGVDFDTLAERRLFGPMGMSLTTFREPSLPAADARRAPARFEGLWSQGFQRKDGSFKQEKFEHIAQIGPAGGASSNAADMARYLRMLLNGGTLDGNTVLTASEFARLQGEPLFRNAAQGTGFSYGFFKRRYGRVESLEHGGATSWFHSNFVAVPALGVGVFVSTNTDSGRKFAAELPEKILARYFPQARPAPLPAAAKKFDAGRFAGEYFSERSNYSTAEKMLLNTFATIGAGDGGLTLSVNGETTRWVPEDGLRFREAEGQGRMTFFADGDGRITGFASAGGHNVFVRAGTFDTPNALALWLIAAAAVAILALIGGILRASRKSRERGRDAHRHAARWLYLAALVWLGFLGVLVAALLAFSQDAVEAFYRYPGGVLKFALWLSPLAMLMTAVSLLLLPQAWRRRDWNIWRKLRHTAVVAVWLVAGWALWHWNLVGWKL